MRTILLSMCVLVFAATASLAKNHKLNLIPLPPGETYDLGPEEDSIKDIRLPCLKGENCDLDQFIKDELVCALLVVKDGRVRLERYAHQEKCPLQDTDAEKPGAKRRYGAASVAKSFMSTLLAHAVAIHQGNPKGLDLDFLRMKAGEVKGKELAGTGFADVTVDHILRMRSGLDFDEYKCKKKMTNCNREMKRIVFTKESEGGERKPFLAYAKGLKSGSPGAFDYMAANPVALAVIAKSYLKPNEKLGRDLIQKFWDSLGMESEASWAIDVDGIPNGSCCLYMNARDFAKFGQFALMQGKNFRNKQLIPANWFSDEIRLRPGVDDKVPEDNFEYNGNCPLHYRHQWWLFENSDDFTAVGTNGQFVHIYPQHGVVIVQISGWPTWNNNLECLAFRAHSAILHELQK